MNPKKNDRSSWTPGPAWNSLIIFLSGYVIFALILSFLYRIPEDEEFIKILSYGDTAACVFLLIDVFLRFMAAPDRVAFWKYGWIDLISSIPNFAPARWGRIYSILRLIRVLRAIKGAFTISHYIFGEKIKSTLAVLVSMMFFCLTISGILVLHIEKDLPGALINNASDAVWWGVNTITTVGSGDVYPITQEGRIVGMFLMIFGIGLFTSCSGVAAAWIMKGNYRRHVDSDLFGQKGSDVSDTNTDSTNENVDNADSTDANANVDNTLNPEADSENGDPHQ